MYLGQQQGNTSSPAMTERKPVERWCLAGNVGRLEVVGWQIEAVVVMRDDIEAVPYIKLFSS